MKLKTAGLRVLALALVVGSVLLGGTGVAVAAGSPSPQGPPTYGVPPYVPAQASQWTISGVTPTMTISVQGGNAGRIWQVYQVTNVGTTPLSKAIVQVGIMDVDVNGTWCYSTSCLGLVQLLNSNGVLPIGETTTGVDVQDLGTINPGSSSDHVLNMRYDSSVLKFEVWIWVWYLP